VTVTLVPSITAVIADINRENSADVRELYAFTEGFAGPWQCTDRNHLSFRTGM